MNVPLGDAIAATAARVVHRAKLPAQLALATDSRALVLGETYVALRGERFDGHAYIAEALARGAVAVVVDDDDAVPEGTPALVVADTRAAYLAMAGAARRRSRARVVALTGSTGKTTTTAFVAQLLERLAGPGRVIATPSNENNEIGVSKLLLRLAQDTEFAVVEFGARHYGEIEPLARAALPEVAIITNIGDAHLEIFGTQERLAETKWGIFATGAVPVLNAADEVSVARAQVLARPITWFGTTRETVRASRLESDRTVLVLRAIEGDALAVIGPDSGLYRARIEIAGDHNRENVAAAAAAAVTLGFAPPDVARALDALRLPPGRYERLAVAPLEVIYDAYNASASGTLATLRSFARENARRRIAVLGSMAELGADAVALHERVGAAAAETNLEWLLVGGDYADDMARGARGAGFHPSRIVYYATNAEAVAWLHDSGRDGDLVLLKASRKYKLEEIVEGLRGTHAGR